MTTTFHVMVPSYGSPTQVAEVYTDEEYMQFDIDTNPAPANRVRECVTVANGQAMEQWIAAKNCWLEAAWTPNQYSDDRDGNDRYELLRKNTAIRAEAERTMASLEIDAPSTVPAPIFPDEPEVFTDLDGNPVVPVRRRSR